MKRCDVYAVCSVQSYMLFKSMCGYTHIVCIKNAIIYSFNVNFMRFLCEYFFFDFSQFSFACQDFKTIWHRFYPFIFEMCMKCTTHKHSEFWSNRLLSIWFEIGVCLGNFYWKNSLLSLTGLIINRLIAHKIICFVCIAVDWILMKRIFSQKHSHSNDCMQTIPFRLECKLDEAHLAFCQKNKYISTVKRKKTYK